MLKNSVTMNKKQYKCRTCSCQVQQYSLANCVRVHAWLRTCPSGSLHLLFGLVCVMCCVRINPTVFMCMSEFWLRFCSSGPVPPLQHLMTANTKPFVYTVLLQHGNQIHYVLYLYNIFIGLLKQFVYAQVFSSLLFKTSKPAIGRFIKKIVVERFV